MIDRLRIVFLGTPDFAVPTLQALVREGPGRGWRVAGAVCQPDRPVGRGQRLQSPPVRRAAAELGIEVLQPERVRGAAAQAWLRQMRPDALAVVAFGQLLPSEVFRLPRLGAINAHASLLPLFRGAAPIQWAIARGEGETGVTTMQIDAGLDTGAMLLRRTVPIGVDVTAPELSAVLSGVAAELMVESIAELERGTLAATPQPAEGTYAPRLGRSDGEIAWSLAASEIYDRWRGFQPWPGVHTYFRGHKLALIRCHAEPAGQRGEPGTLVEIAAMPAVICGLGVLHLDEVRVEGRQAVLGGDFARGARIQWGRERVGAEGMRPNPDPSAA